ncbi:MAG: glycosyltransferase [Bacillota bacterium]
MNKPILSVVVCTYNRETLLPFCLQSLQEQTLDQSLYEVVIIDNNSDDGTHSIVKSYLKRKTNCRFFVEYNQGIGFARDRGWRESAGIFIAYLDDDARAGKEWCERILKIFSAVKPMPAAVGGKYLPIYETDPPVWFKDDFEIRTWGEKPGFLSLPARRYGFSGACMAIRRDILQSYGGFSTGLGMKGNKIRIGEETEFFYRLQEKDLLLWYDPDLIVHHWTPARNMGFKYRFNRSLISGKFLAGLHRRKRYWYDYIKQFAYKLFFPAVFLISISIFVGIMLLLSAASINIAKDRCMAQVYKLAGKAGIYLGYFIG